MICRIRLTSRLTCNGVTLLGSTSHLHSILAAGLGTCPRDRKAWPVQAPWRRELAPVACLCPLPAGRPDHFPVVRGHQRWRLGAPSLQWSYLNRLGRLGHGGAAQTWDAGTPKQARGHYVEPADPTRRVLALRSREVVRQKGCRPGWRAQGRRGWREGRQGCG